MEKIKLIHVGLGGWGLSWARDAFPRHHDICVVGYVDSDEAALRRAQDALGLSSKLCFADLSLALRAVACDAVIVCLPVHLHAQIAAAALAAGKHVVVEKPFTSTLDEAHELVGLAEAKGLILMVSQNYRYFPAPVLAADIVGEGLLGRLGQIKVDFRQNAMASGHVYPGLKHPLLVDMAVHHYDLARMIVGEDPVELSCRSWNLEGSPFSGDASGAMVLSFPSGSVMSYRGSWVDQATETSWAGEWQMDFAHGSVLFTSRSGGHDWWARERLSIKRLNGQPEKQKLLSVKPHGRRGVLAALATAIRNGREPRHFPSGRSNLATLAIIEAALRSSASAGASVRIADVLAPSRPSALAAG